MAEIGIEKKKPIWPWIILVLVILAILYFLFAGGNDDMDDIDDTNTEQVEDTTTWDNEMQDTTSAWDNNDTLGVSGFVSHVGDKTRMGIDHEYTNNALIRLMDAVESKAREENVNIDTEMQEIRQQANEITQDPMATDHANIIKDAGAKIVDALEKVQQENYPDLSQDVEDLRSSLQGIDPSVQTLEQKDDVNSFFDKAADVLQKMS
ncbi:hypothetical protein GCM10007103_24170 [Salinimicrobium marinum]|uniref:Uncharacterized protein n=1 Tax=Salinimicrobium marinum TaxID=680283 RepID=A0A918W0E6_9FLAO|nr:hypothetical protein [Salinimicrobium marinum]GHA42019.1 hypothetical protein GCM10007103_24170 [Salinimicrobium marinum]